MIFFVILYGLTQICYRKFPPQHQYRRHYHQLGRPPPPFSVSLQDAITTKSFFLLSAIRIPPAWCPSFIQHWIKMITFTKHNQDLLRLHHRKRYGYKGLSLCLLPFLYFFSIPPTAHALPGTNHVLVHDQSSLDLHRQQNYVNTIVSNLKETTCNIAPPTVCNSVTSSTGDTKPTFPINNEPHCFLVDTDSIPFVIDSGANRIIVNDVRLLSAMKHTSDKIKGIGGKCTRITAKGFISLSLKSDNGLVNTSPCNIIPSQLLISEMKKCEYWIKSFAHDDKIYKFEYSKSYPPNDTTTNTITGPIQNNGLFPLRTNPGFTQFMKRASYFLNEFEKFAGTSHAIPDDTVSSSPSVFPPKSSKKRRRFAIYLPSYTKRGSIVNLLLLRLASLLNL